MEANPTQIISYFNGFRQSLVPLFQRAYEWEIREWEMLWKDILDQYEGDNDTTHFMGAIVTIPTKSEPAGVNKYLLIDGQQRLTTISILLCSIRDAIGIQSDKHYNKIQAFHLTNFGHDGLDYFKLLPTQVDRASYISLASAETNAIEGNIGDAYRYFLALIAGKDSEGAQIDPIKLLQVLEHRLMVVCINLGDADDPYLIFESLNFKGSPLTQADLVRNYLLMRFRVDKQAEIYNLFWMPMQERLGESITEFMRQYLMADGEVVRKGEIYASLKRRLVDIDSKGVEAVLKKMCAFSTYYLRFIKPENEKHDELRRDLEKWLRWDVNAAYPLMLRLYNSYIEKVLSIDQLRHCFKMLESFIIRRTFCRAPTNQLVKIFVGWSKAYPDDGEISDWLATRLSEGSAGRRWPDDAEFSVAWKSHPIYSDLTRCRLVLEEIQYALSGSQSSRDLSRYFIERIMPESLSNDWKLILGPEYARIHAAKLNTIGNLTLVESPDLSNLASVEKLLTLDKSRLIINSHMLDFNEWTEAAIEKRSELLFETAKLLWPRIN